MKDEIEFCKMVIDYCESIVIDLNDKNEMAASFNLGKLCIIADYRRHILLKEQNDKSLGS